MLSQQLASGQYCAQTSLKPHEDSYEEIQKLNKDDSGTWNLKEIEHNGACHLDLHLLVSLIWLTHPYQPCTYAT